MVGSVLFALVTADGQRILMEQRPARDSYFPGQWVIPGGKPEPGENSLATLVREMREELGCKPCIALDLSPYINQKLYYVHEGDPRFRVLPYQIVSWDGHVPARVLDTGHELRWFSPSEVQASPAGFTRQVGLAIAGLALRKWRWPA